MHKTITSIALAALLPALFLSCNSRPSVDLVNAPAGDVRITSPDTALVNIFNWAQKTSNGYVGSDSDPVGPWYEAALPGREAFCIRDVSHQSIGAEILGQGRQNFNMFNKFTANISESKDWCSYWEINRYDKPAPADYLSDDDFWYNLNASFDVIDACRKLYEWTGNRSYIEDPQFDRFFQLTLNQYVDKWQLAPETIMARPAFMNRKPDTKKYFYARGIPSYDEQQSDISVSGDLIGMIFNAYRTYADLLKLTGRSDESGIYERKAEQYRKLIDSLWIDKSTDSYFGFYKQSEGKFYPGGLAASEFLLWYHVIDRPEQIVRALDELKNSQVEVLAYLPMLFYRYGYNPEAYGYLGKIYTDKRRMYPEASAGAIEGIVRGMMGVEPVASENLVATCPRLNAGSPWVAVEDIPVLGGKISVRHESDGKTILANRSVQNLTWRATFRGSFGEISIDGKKTPASTFKDAIGNVHSYADVKVPAGSQVTAEAVTAR